MLNLIDFLVIGLFITIVISIYKILKPENIEITNVVSGASLNKKALKSLIKSKDKKFANLIIETLSNESIETKAQKLSKLDKSFEPQSFMEKSKQTFESILKAFEEKNRDQLKTLVSPNVYKVFEESISEFETKNQTLNTEIIRFKRILIKDIGITKKSANILIEFITEQITVLKDKAGKIIKGDDNQIETITDTWTFTKDYSKKNPSWILSETIEI